MEAPPPLSAAPPISTTTTTTTTATPAVHAASVDSSPRTRHTGSWDADPPPPKLRLMCSYGGHIGVRPHDMTLCYAGGDTRIITIDRRTSFSDLYRRLSKNLLNNQPFSLKYKLPNEGLDSLISVATDEDLENMVEEHDRLASGGGGAKPGRLRLFLFPKSSTTTKSEGWFFNALSGKVSYGGSDRAFSNSSSVNCLLGLNDYLVAKAAVVVKDVEAQIERSKTVGTGNRILNGNSVGYQDVHSVPDSAMNETSSSSFGSTSSSLSFANPKIGGSGIEERFQQMSVGVAGNVNPPPQPKQDEARVFTAAGVADGTVVSGLLAVVSGFPAVAGGEYAANRGSSDDERSDHGGYRKVQQIQPQVQQSQSPESQQMNFGVVGNVIPPPQPKQDDARVFTAAAVAAGTVVSELPAVVSVSPGVVGVEYAVNRGSSDGERSDHGGYRNVQQIQPLVQQTHLQPQQPPEYPQMNFEVVGNVNSAPQPKQDDARVLTAAAVAAGTVVGGDHATNRGSSDDERSDHGGYRRVQQIRQEVQQIQLQPQQTPQVQQNSELQQMNFEVVGNVNPPPQPKHEDARVFTATAVAAGTLVPGLPAVVPGLPVVVGCEYAANRGSSDDEKLDHGGYRKVQQAQQQVQQIQLQPQQAPQFQQNQITTSDLPSPDSISSEGSIKSPQPKQIQTTTHQEPLLQKQYSISPNLVFDQKTTDQNSNKEVQMQPQFQEPGYNLLSGQYNQNLITPQQFIHPTNHYLPPGAAYYQTYPFQEQQQQPMLNHQYPIYCIPVNAPLSKPEMVGGVQYIRYNPIHQPSSGVNSGYSYEYSDQPNHGQMYYTTPLPHQQLAAAQYQNVAPGPTVADTSSAQQVRSSQQ